MRRVDVRHAAIGAGLLLGCGPGAPDVRARDTTATAAPAAPADTLVLTTRGGYQIWLTGGRQGRDSSGTACVERSVEIRRDTSRVLVPLLFVTVPPTELGSAEIKAELSLACRTMAIYRVELATGRPRKIEDR